MSKTTLCAANIRCFSQTTKTFHSFSHTLISRAVRNWAANITKAGLGQGVMSPGNFEAGIMTENPNVIAALNVHFSEIMDGVYCDNCHRAMDCVEY